MQVSLAHKPISVKSSLLLPNLTVSKVGNNKKLLLRS